VKPTNKKRPGNRPFFVGSGESSYQREKPTRLLDVWLFVALFLRLER